MATARRQSFSIQRLASCSSGSAPAIADHGKPAKSFEKGAAARKQDRKPSGKPSRKKISSSLARLSMRESVTHREPAIRSGKKTVAGYTQTRNTFGQAA